MKTEQETAVKDGRAGRTFEGEAVTCLQNIAGTCSFCLVPS